MMVRRNEGVARSLMSLPFSVLVGLNGLRVYGSLIMYTTNVYFVVDI